MQILKAKRKVTTSRALVALGLSVIADTMEFLDVVAFAFPIIGDVSNAALIGALYAITRNKKSTAINLIKFIPVLGNIIPVYTITTLLWIYSEARRRDVKSSDYLKEYQ